MDPENTSPGVLADEQTFAGKHGFAETLRLVILLHTSRAGQESVFARAPSLLAGQTDIGNIAKRERCQEKFAWASVRGNRHFAASDELFHAELDGALESHGGRHSDHGAWLDFERATDGQLDGQNGVAVAMADAVAATIESADIVYGRAGALEVALRRGASGHC